MSGAHPSTMKDARRAKKTIGLQHLEPEIPRKTWIFFSGKNGSDRDFSWEDSVEILRYSRTAPKKC